MVLKNNLYNLRKFFEEPVKRVYKANSLADIKTD